MNDIFWEHAKTFTFVKRNAPVSVTLRPMYRISLISLSLYFGCKKKQGSFLRLQFLNWILKDRDLQQKVITSIQILKTYHTGILHLDPFFNVALQFAVAEKLVTMQANKKIVLAESGMLFCQYITENNLFENEVSFLKKVGTKLSDSIITRQIKEE